MSGELRAACRAAAAAGRAGATPAPDPDPGDLRSALLAAADTHGALVAALETTIDHVRSRHQFGRPLGAFQAVAHHLADVATVVDALGLAVERAASREDPPAPDVAVAALLAIEDAPAACNRLHQVTGAAGLYADHPLARCTPRVLGTAVALGGAERYLDLLVPPPS